MAFYDMFERLCSERGITPTQVARDTGLTQQTVSHWKTRGSVPKARTIQKLADYFGVSVYKLLDERDEDIFMAAEIGLIEENFKQGYRFTDDEVIIVRLYHSMNNYGKERATEHLLELSWVPRYQATTAPESTPASQEGKDTTPSSDVPQRPQEDET